MPLCKECENHFMKYNLEIAGKIDDFIEELPSLYKATPTCPVCGLIGDIKKTKLRDALYHLKKEYDDEETVMNFMAYYRKRNKDFRDGFSIVQAFTAEAV